MGKIEVGEYIRTIDGYIRKVIQVNKKGTYDALCHGAYNVDIPYKNSLGISAKKIKAHSKKIIELIEPKDIIQIKRGLYDDYNFIFITSTDDIYADREFIEEYMINILTHEQYENNCYKVKE